MLAAKTGQVGFFDAAELARPLPAGSFFSLLAEHGDRIVRDEDFAACYSERVGRPSIPPSQLAKVLLLQYRTGASDEQAMECVAWDLRWKIALGLSVDHQGWHPTSLTKFRARLLLHRLERVALERTLSVAEELGMLEGPVEQIIDSTPMLGAAATQDTVRLVRHGVRKLLDAVAAVDRQAAGQLDRALAFDYEKPADKPDCRWREKAERERILTRVAQDAERALQAVQQAEGLLNQDLVAAGHKLLRELIGQDFELDDGVPRLHRGTAAGRIISTVDTEMRHGRKSQHQRFDGYKLSAAITNTSEPLITAVDVAPASAQDGPQAKHLIDAQPPDRRPARVLGDTAYGIGPVRAELAERGVEVLAPLAPGMVKPGRIAKHEFTIDPTAGRVICPAGHAAPVRTEPSGQRRASFSRQQCGPCPAHDRCAGPTRGVRQIAIAHDEELLLAAREALDDPVNAQHLRRTRPRIERLLGLLAHRYHARKSRYIGTRKTRLQAAWTAALVNLNPIGRHLTQTT
jgi:transposase